jgi:transcriptional regulator with PAS, ATPase and Fis domain
MVSRGTFREDLFYRLRVVEIGLPPLRERPGDIPVLVEGLLAKINRDLDKDVRYVTPAALARLQAYAWPGNVRELENMLTRALVLAKADVLDDAAAARRGSDRRGSDRGRRRWMPRARCRRCARSSASTSSACSRTEWNAARLRDLDISRPTLDRKIESTAAPRRWRDSQPPHCRQHRSRRRNDPAHRAAIAAIGAPMARSCCAPHRIAATTRSGCSRWSMPR